MTADTFKPTFRSDVGVVNAMTSPPQFSAINPSYCATSQCGADLAALLADMNPKVVLDWPMQGWPQANAYYQTAQVPYLQFPDGTKVNAGIEASFFTHGYPPSFAEQAVRNDITMTIQANATSGQNT